MTKKEFLDELEQRLKRLPKTEREETIRFYEEYFAEAGEENEQNVIKELRSPTHIAAKILSEYADKTVESSSKSPRRSFKAIWFTILGIFAAPIAVPIAILLVVILVALGIFLFALSLGLTVAGGVLTIFALLLLFIKPATAIMIIGSVLIVLGVIRLVYGFTNKAIKAILKFIRTI